MFTDFGDRQTDKRTNRRTASMRKGASRYREQRFNQSSFITPKAAHKSYNITGKMTKNKRIIASRQFAIRCLESAPTKTSVKTEDWKEVANNRTTETARRCHRNKAAWRNCCGRPRCEFVTKRELLGFEFVVRQQLREPLVKRSQLHNRSTTKTKTFADKSAIFTTICFSATS